MQYREAFDACLESFELMERTIDEAPGLPLELCGPDELERWTTAITTIILNVGLALHVLRKELGMTSAEARE